MVSAELGCPVALDTHPKHAVAMGAAHLASCGAPVAAPIPAGSAARLDAAGPPPTRELPPTSEPPPPAAAPPAVADRPPHPAPEARPDAPLSWDEWKARTATPPPSSGLRRASRRRVWLIPAVLLGLLLVGGAVAIALAVGLPARDREPAPREDAFQSDALQQFAAPLLAAPGASCAPASERDSKGQREAVDCRWDNGMRGRFYLAADRSGLDQVREVFLSSAGTVPDSFTRAAAGWNRAQPGAPGTRQGEYSQYVLANDNSANIYFDQESTLCWGVLWLPSGDQQTLRDFWLKVT